MTEIHAEPLAPPAPMPADDAGLLAAMLEHVPADEHEQVTTRLRAELTGPRAAIFREWPVTMTATMLRGFDPMAPLQQSANGQWFRKVGFPVDANAADPLVQREWMFVSVTGPDARTGVLQNTAAHIPDAQEGARVRFTVLDDGIALADSWLSLTGGDDATT